MKRSFSLLTLGLAVASLMTACKRTPSPPTEQDAIAVWKNTHAKPHLEDLISLTKTNGQMEEVNGVRVYCTTPVSASTSMTSSSVHTTKHC
jgi:hypothetical protein